jgi:hypothetical protein
MVIATGRPSPAVPLTKMKGLCATATWLPPGAVIGYERGFVTSTRACWLPTRPTMIRRPGASAGRRRRPNITVTIDCRHLLAQGGQAAPADGQPWRAGPSLMQHVDGDQSSLDGKPRGYAAPDREAVRGADGGALMVVALQATATGPDNHRLLCCRQVCVEVSPGEAHTATELVVHDAPCHHLLAQEACADPERCSRPVVVVDEDLCHRVHVAHVVPPPPGWLLWERGRRHRLSPSDRVRVYWSSGRGLRQASGCWWLAS